MLGKASRYEWVAHWRPFVLYLNNDPKPRCHLLATSVLPFNLARGPVQKEGYRMQW